MTHIPYEEYIWGDKFKATFSNVAKVCYCNNVDGAYLKKHISNTAKVIITHNGDNPVYRDNINNYPQCLYWFAQNVICEDPRVIPLPIGLENDYIGGQPLRKQILCEKSSTNIIPSKLAYLNCSVSTCRVDREPAYAYFSGKTWCMVKLPNPSNYYNFCDEILQHNFIISPRGNGLDCHRSWEVLYLNRYPVMKKYYGLQKVFEDLPVVFVNDWNEVTEYFLKEKLIEIKNTKYNMEKLKFSYWKKYIQEKIQELS